MLDRKYSREQRRALNIIWNAAGRYGWDPYFMAFQQDGKPDFYFNTLLGLSDKYLGAERVETFFSRYESAGRRDEFDDLLWLALESWLYAREEPGRPALAGLRREHAQRFFRELQLLSRQEMMIHSALTPKYHTPTAAAGSMEMTTSIMILEVFSRPLVCGPEEI